MEQFKDMEDRFEELITGLTRAVDFEIFPDSIFFFRGENCLFEYEVPNSTFWCDQKKVWNYLEADIFVDNQILLQECVKRKMKRYLNIEAPDDNYIFPLDLSSVKRHFS